MPLGQTAAQGVWARLGETCLEVAAGDLEDLWSNAFLSDISAMNHEVMTARMFQT
jgi:urease accessory protein